MIGTRRVVIGAVSTFTLLAIGWVILSRSGSGGDVILSSGTVESTEADLGFQHPGRIERITVQEGDTVRAGIELGWLDRSELLAMKRAAEAQARAAEARLTELERGFRSEEIAQGQAALRSATRRLREVERDVVRLRRLFAGGAVSQQQLDQAETAYEVAQADSATARERLDILETGPRVEQIAAQRALVAQARAAVAQVDASIANATIVSPTDGIVTVRHREPGETVPAGAPVLTVRNRDDRWVRIFVREALVGRLTVGLAARITADAYPDREYGGRVVFIASEAEFTPRNVQTTDERVKLVYRVKVRITEDASYDLKPGLPADVRLLLDGR